MPQQRKFIFANHIRLEAIQVKFMYEGHRVEVNVTRAKRLKIAISVNVKLASAITPVL